jgi:hypothetical protein
MLFPTTVNPAYRRGNADAHRVRPPSCVPPAVVSHQAFWISHKEQSKRLEERHRVKCIVDNLILEIAGWTKQRHQVSVRIDPEIEGTNALFANVAFPGYFLINQNALLPDGKLNQSTLTIAQRNAFESDHRVVSILFRLNECDVTIRFEFHTEYFSISTFAEIADYEHIERGQLMMQLQSGRLDGDVKKLKQELYEDFWRELTNNICPTGALKNAIFSQMFCDFRGIVISNEELLQRGKTGQPVDGYLSLLSPLGSEEIQHECAVSYMLGGRALHMTTLGLQLPEDAGNKRSPLTYLLCVNPETTRWQRGGLIDLIHSAGASRLAALKDLSALRRAGGDLAGLDNYTSIARSAVSEHRRQTPPTNDAQESISSAQDYFSLITRNFNREVEGNYGILFRIERSRYYVERFRANARQMRILRVEGYQKYDQFVETRVGATFDFIDRLGRRYERGVSALALLDSYNLSIQSNEIALSQKQTEDKETAISENIRKIQEYGDFVLIAALLPYYVTALIGHVLGEEHIHYFAFAIWTMAFVLALYRTKEQENLSRTTRIIVVGKALRLAFIAWIAVWVFDKGAPVVLDPALSIIQWIIHWIALQLHPFF